MRGQAPNAGPQPIPVKVATCTTCGTVTTERDLAGHRRERCLGRPVRGLTQAEMGWAA